jgi:hypothetical protein
MSVIALAGVILVLFGVLTARNKITPISYGVGVFLERHRMGYERQKEKGKRPEPKVPKKKK